MINAHVRLVVKRYLGVLNRSLADTRVQASLYTMQSSGGIMMAAAVREKPIHMIESGPVSGFMGALHFNQVPSKAAHVRDRVIEA